MTKPAPATIIASSRPFPLSPNVRPLARLKSERGEAGGNRVAGRGGDGGDRGQGRAECAQGLASHLGPGSDPAGALRGEHSRLGPRRGRPRPYHAAHGPAS